MKLSVLQRKFVFWGVCIPLRAYLSSMGDSEYLRVFGAYIGSRWLLGAESGTIGAFGGKAWWAEERAMHGLIWLVYSLTGESTWLQLDVLIAALNWMSSSPSTKS